jgi:hypothetical protein
MPKLKVSWTIARPVHVEKAAYYADDVYYAQNKLSFRDDYPRIRLHETSTYGLGFSPSPYKTHVRLNSLPLGLSSKRDNILILWDLPNRFKWFNGILNYETANLIIIGV